jgi:hypothetical protein
MQRSSNSGISSGLGGSASTALGTRHAPKTITVRLVLPDENEEPPAPKRAGIT